MPKGMPDLFGSGEVRVLRLETAAGLLSLAVVILICMLLWQKVSGLPVCYGTVEAAPGLIVPNEVPESHVRALSEQVALVLYNNTWETAEASHSRVAQLLHPQLLGVFTVRMAHERALMKEHNLSTQLSIRSTAVGKSGRCTAATWTRSGGCSPERCPFETRSWRCRCVFSACSRARSIRGAWP